MEQVLLEPVEKMENSAQICQGMDQRETPWQRQLPASEIITTQLGAKWLERPVCKSRPGNSGRQHIEHKSAELTTDWAALTRAWPAVQGD